jgi:ribosomal-protein-serine acetyltransferase
MFETAIDGTDLKLRLVSLERAEEIHELVVANYEHLRPWLPWVSKGYTIESAISFIKTGLAGYEKRTSLQTWIFDREQIVGGIGFNSIDSLNRSVEIGYWLTASAIGGGVMTKSCKALVDCAFREYGIHRIVIRCARENIKSQAIPKRLGFVEEGTMRDAEWLHDRFVDLTIYSKLKSDQA